jgi:hypothetical protein
MYSDSMIFLRIPAESQKSFANALDDRDFRDIEGRKKRRFDENIKK